MVKFLEGNRNNDDSSKYGIIQSLWAARVVIGIALLAVMVRVCGSDWVSGQVDTPPGLVSTTEVVSNTEDLIGKNVTIKSTLQNIVGPSSFMVSDRQFGGDEPIMVVNASGQPFDLPPDPNVAIQAMGEVREFVIPEIEREFNLNLQDEYYTDHINKPAVIARSIMLAPTPAQVATSPNRYYGRRVTVTGTVGNIQSPVLFSLNEKELFGEQNLPILLTTPPDVAINQGQTVAVVGVVRPFVAAEIERDYNIKWNSQVKKQLEAEYQNRPIFIAQAVYPSSR